MHNDEATTADFAVDVPVSERPKLYNKAMYLLKLKHERRISQVAIDGLISDTATLIEEELLSVKNKVIQCLEEGHAPAELISNINEKLSKRISTQPFEGLQSAYLQKKYYLENFNLVVCNACIHAVIVISHVHTHKHTRTHTYTPHMHTHTCTHTRTHTHTHTHTHAC